MEIHFAPIQGFTDNAYRISHFTEVGNVDFYYTPYYSIDNINKVSLGKKINPNPSSIFNITIPQILPANISELKILLQFVLEMKVSEINLNLGCPYPMATNKGRGAALIQQPELVSNIINYISDNSDLKISVKSRIGLNDENEIFPLLEILNVLKCENVIIHPRIAKQLYKGKIFTDIFVKCKELFPDINFIYNGDILTIEDFNSLKQLFPEQEKWMIGRGLLFNPFLASQIKSGLNNESKINIESLISFSHLLITEIEKDSNDSGHALNRVKNQFSYLASTFPDSKKTLKKIKKSKSIDEIRFIINH